MEECKICKEYVADDINSVKLTKKGKNGVNKKSREIGDDIKLETGDKVHKDCRKNYLKRKVRKRKISSCTRSNSSFDFRTKCFVCGNLVTKRELNKSGCISKVSCKYGEVDKKIEQQIELRGDDPWAVAVNGRFQCKLSDLRAEDAIYHVECYQMFIGGRSIPMKHSPGDDSSSAKRVKRGRPLYQKVEESFAKAVEFLLEKSREDELVTLHDLHCVMDGYGRSFSTKWIQARLLKDFPDEIIITSVSGKENVITFVSTANKILTDFHGQNSKDPEAETMALITAAAKIIKNEIKNKQCDMSMYPTFNEDELSTAYLTPMLNLFLQEIITATGHEIKRASIGQSIMQCCRPRSLLCPIPVGLAVQSHSMFGSRILCDLLNNLGYCISYTEILKFESCAAFHQNISLPPIPDDSVLHFAADNVDHNIRTLDGHGTFHGMGIIAIVTRGCFSPINVPRRTVSSAEILSVGSIEFKIFKLKQKNLSFKYQKQKGNLIFDNTRLLGTLWQSAWILKPSQPQWNGFMQSVLDGDYPGKSTVYIMPMIDEKSSDYSCIYTTMLFIAEQAKKYNKTPILTFDQPLYWKSVEIQMQEQNSIIGEIVLILGSFHTLMSFLGSIGSLMNGTGLNSLLEQVYAENAVPHIMSGKTVARARRAHRLAICALEGIKISEIYEVDLSSLDSTDISEHFLKNEELSKLSTLLHECVNGEVGVSDLPENETFRKLMMHRNDFNEKHKDSKTSLLWIMYMDMVDIFTTFIKAERTGNFLLHLQSIIYMLPYFAASGHFLYLKSAYCYVQQMQELQTKNPIVYECFLNGYHIVRRSDKFFAGIGTDLMIEQELMRSVKTTGGLTHGRGMTDLQRTKWVLSTTTTAAVRKKMEEFSGVRYEGGEQHIDQHKEISKARLSRDYNDAMKMMKYLEHRNPFEGHKNLVSIETGEEGDEAVNVQLSKEIGQKMVDAMADQPILSISFTRKGMATTMKPRASIEVEGEVIPVDPQLLFQRLVILVQNDETLLQKALAHELSSHPASLFGNNGLMLEADKPSLGDEIWNVAEKNVTVPDDVTYVLDGGHLLFKMKWKKGKSFEEIFRSYENYVLKHYGGNSIIVFDGYPDEPDTKDTTHLRRKLRKSGKCVNITPHMKLNMNKENFLSVLKNKQLFNSMLMQYLNSSSNGIHAIQDVADADYLIAKTAIDVSKEQKVIVISADTDVLILLIHGADSKAEQMILTSDLSTTSSKIWDIIQIRNSLGSEVCDNILSVHSFLGCDTVSRIFGFGKGKGLRLFLKDPDFRQHISEFTNDDCLQDKISSSGEKLIIMLYGGKGTDNLDDLRYITFQKKLSSSTKAILPEHLPPTSDAARFHSLRAYYQVQTWKGKTLPVDEWGFVRRGKYLLPKLMSKLPAPSNLMKLIKCNCSTGCNLKGRCSCRKNNIKCTPMCGTCKGVSCTNHQECVQDET